MQDKEIFKTHFSMEVAMVMLSVFLLLLAPVVFQILVPLCMLLVYMLCRMLALPVRNSKEQKASAPLMKTAGTCIQ